MDFMLALLLVVAAGWAAGLIANRLGYPGILGELIVGIVLGPPLLGWLPAHEGLHVVAELGIFIMMLYIGAEIDLKEMIKSTRAAMLAAIGGFILPFAAGFAVTWLYLSHYPVAGTTPERVPFFALMGGLFTGITCAGTSLAAKSRILLDLKLLDTRIAMVLMAGALFSDTAALIVFAGVTGIAAGGAVDPLMVATVAGKAIAFFLIAGLLGVFVFPHIRTGLDKLGLKGLTATLTVLLMVALAFGGLAHALGLHNILGAFMAGLFLRRSVTDRQEFQGLTQHIHAMSIGFLAPVFFVTAGFAFDLNVFRTDLPLLLAVVFAAIAGKLLGTLLFYLPSRHGWREGLAIGCGMNGRGAVEIIIAGVGLQQLLIGKGLYSVIVFMAIFTTLITPLTLKACTDWLRRRDELVQVSHRERILIVGAGPLGRLLAVILGDYAPVTLVDRNHELCDAAERQDLNVFRGNALDEQLLNDAGAVATQTVIALTPNAEINLLAARFAGEHFLVPNLVAWLEPHRADELRELLVRHHVRPLTGRPPELTEWDRSVTHRRYDIDLITVANATQAEDLRRQVANDPVLFLLKMADGHPHIAPRPDDIQPDDVLLLLRQQTGETVTVDRFDRLVAKAPVLDLEDKMSFATFLGHAADRLVPGVGLTRDEFISAYQDRERESGTVMGQGVAIPHIDLPGHGRLHLLLARCRDGVDFETGDEPVHTIFLLASTRDQRNAHLRSLAAIAQIVHAKSFESLWLQATNPDHLRQLVLEAKRHRL